MHERGAVEEAGDLFRFVRHAVDPLIVRGALLGAIFGDEVREARAGNRGFEARRLRNGPLRHVAAIRPAANGEPFAVGNTSCHEVVDARHHVAVIATAPVATIHLNEFLAVTAGASNVGIKNRVSSRRQELAPRFNGILPIARGPAVDQNDERQFGLAVVAAGFQESGFDFQAVEGFVSVELRRAERELFPGIVEVRDLLGGRFLIPEPEFLWRGRGMSKEDNITRIRCGKRRRIGRQGRRRVFQGSFWGEGDELTSEAIGDDGQQAAVLAPPILKDGTIDAGASEILSGLFTLMNEHEVAWDWTIHAAAYERSGLAIGRHTNFAERTAWGENLCLRVI